MKHSREFAYATALPHAPLDMPKQRLETRRSFFRAIFDTFSAFTGR